MQTLKTGPEVYGHTTEQRNRDWELPMDGDAGEEEEEEEEEAEEER
jgi:hypothetical protein